MTNFMIGIITIFASFAAIYVYYSLTNISKRRSGYAQAVELQKIVKMAQQRENRLRRMGVTMTNFRDEDSIDQWLERQLSHDQTSVAVTMTGWLEMEKYEQDKINRVIREDQAKALALELAEKQKAENAKSAERAVQALLAQTPAQKAAIQAAREKATKLKEAAKAAMDKAQAALAIEATKAIEKKKAATETTEALMKSTTEALMKSTTEALTTEALMKSTTEALMKSTKKLAIEEVLKNAKYEIEALAKKAPITDRVILPYKMD